MCNQGPDYWSCPASNKAQGALQSIFLPTHSEEPVFRNVAHQSVQTADIPKLLWVPERFDMDRLGAKHALYKHDPAGGSTLKAEGQLYKSQGW
jgi:hypothetical protein